MYWDKNARCAQLNLSVCFESSIPSKIQIFYFVCLFTHKNKLCTSLPLYTIVLSSMLFALFCCLQKSTTMRITVSLCQHHPFKGNNQMLIHGFLEFLFYHTFSKIQRRKDGVSLKLADKRSIHFGHVFFDQDPLKNSCGTRHHAEICQIFANSFLRITLSVLKYYFMPKITGMCYSLHFSQIQKNRNCFSTDSQ